MELQKFINDNTDYISKFKENNLYTKKYKDLILVKANYDENQIYENKEDYWKMYCRGSIINTKTHKLVCIPPVKAKELNKEEFNQKQGNIEIQELLDGTMINLFYYHENWMISTRSNIGGYNKWNSKSFKQMYEECPKLDYSDLNKKHCYSFVMKHTDNRNISKVTENKLYLVEVYNLENCERLSIDDYPKNIESVNNLLSYYIDKREDLDTNFNIKGYTIKKDNQRFKLINPNYQKVKDLKVNFSGDLITYIELRKNGNLNDYLSYFPEKNKIFNSYRDKIHILSNELYNNYKNVFIFKNKEKKDIPYHLKPFVYEIHSEYLKTKKPTSWADIKDFIYNLPSKRLAFSLNYMN